MKNKELLSSLYKDIRQIILSRQHPVTGLLPASTSINTHGDYTDAWVRDNVYSIFSVWTLSMAYKRVGDEERKDELEQSTIKLMRGLLQSMMRQSPKVETFKHTMNSLDCLHAKYDTSTGLPVVDDDKWGHLQIDATSIFLLMLGQMTASGLRIVNTLDEVDFVQNLIYYIAFAYRIPDYGIWERGNKINNGKTEINASSVGMAKAALQALDGFNLFGPNATPRAIVHTVPDAISRARNTLTRLLPRESISKEVDSAILSIIGFPAFAVGDNDLVKKTRIKILSELGGNYGCKRFLWDGHQAVVEDHNRMHYDHSELANFEHIECEWPLFYTYLYIQALFEDDAKSAKAYRDKLESLMVEVDGKGLLPELYIVPEENIEAERKEPRSQKRVPNDNLPLVWAQSLYYTGLMLDTGLVEKDDLDPLQLRNRSSKSNKTQIALVVLAENDAVKQQLASQGVIAESIDEIKPLGVITSSQLVKTYERVGENPSLGLTGRPKRRFQGLATAQTYNINKNNYLCLSSLQHDAHDYQLFDAQLAADNLTNELIHIDKHWISSEAAVFTYLVNQTMCEGKDAHVLFSKLKNLQLRNEFANVGYASASLAFRASRINKLWNKNANLEALSNTEQSASSSIIAIDSNTLIEPFKSQLDVFGSDETDYQQISQWLTEFALEDSVGDGISFRDLIRNIYLQAEYKQHWLTARLCFSVLKYEHEDVSEDFSLICARNLSIIIEGTQTLTLDSDYAQISQPDLINKIDDVISSPLERSLIQEMLVVLGFTFRTNTVLFDGLRSINLHNLLATSAGHQKCDQSTFESLSLLSPSSLYEKVRLIIESQHKAYSNDVETSFSEHDATATSSYAMNTDWLEWRSERGIISRISDDFLNAIWNSLANTARLIFGEHLDDDAIDCGLIRSSMTPREESFANLIDSLARHLHPTYYKAAVIETLYAYTQYSSRNTGKVFTQPIVLGQILNNAADLFAQDNNISEDERNLDALLQRAPEVLQQYVQTTLENLN